MKTILHIGSEKTGSTSVQAALDKHRDQLLTQGVFFPKWTHPVLKSHVIYPLFLGYDADVGPISNALKKSRKTGTDLPKVAWENIEKAIVDQDPEILVLSSEILFKPLSVEAEHIAKRILSISSEVEVVAYVRNPRDFVISLVNQAFKQVVKCDRVILEKKLEYGAVLRSYAELFGQKVTVFNYGPDLMVDGSIVPHFFQNVLGLPLPEGDVPIFWNITPSPEALSILQSYFHALNKTDEWSFEEVDYRLMSKVLQIDKSLGKRSAALTIEAEDWIGGRLRQAQDQAQFGIVFEGAHNSVTARATSPLPEQFKLTDFFELDPERVAAIEARIKTEVPSLWSAYGNGLSARLRRMIRRQRRR